MTPTRLSLGLASLLLAAIVLLSLHVQPAASRALFAYPMQGQTPEQENADRAACHQWAVEQSGFDPFVGLPQQERSGGVLAGVAINAQPGPTGSGRRVGTGGGISNTMTQAEIRRHNELYDAYLRAGQVCLEGRGYRVTR